VRICWSRVAGVQVLSAAQQPAGDLTDLQRRQGTGRDGGPGAQGLEVAVDGAQAAAVAERGDLGVQHRGVVAAFGPAAVQMWLLAGDRSR
jgi:hypothetical protein